MTTEKNVHPLGPFVNELENATPEKVPEYCSMYSRTSTLLIHVSCVLLFYSSCTDKAIQEFLDVTEHDSVSINMAIDSVS